MRRQSGAWEQLRPDELEVILAEAPVAYLPLGTSEHHGWHLPVGFDGIKADALCRRAAEQTGGVVLPTFWHGIGGGHVGYKWTMIAQEEQVRPLLAMALDHLARFGFRVIVMLTGHYAGEQVKMIHALAEEAAARHPKVTFIGLTEPEISTPARGDRYPGDHAAKYETSIALALNPDWVHLEALTPGRDPNQATLPDTPRHGSEPQWDPEHRLYAIWGQDPSAHASCELGERLVNEIVDRLAAMVDAGLRS
jgi:creatinine amidohydrolase